MKKLFFVLVFIFCFALQARPAYAGSCSATATGNWSTLSWSAGCTGGGGIPATGDSVTINTSVTATLDTATPVLASLTVNGTLDTSGTNYAVSATTLTIGSSGTVTANGSTITLSGTSGTLFTKTAGGTFTAGSSTLVMNGDADLTLFSASTTVNNLTLSPDMVAGVNRAYASGAAITINGNMNINPTNSFGGTPILTVNMGGDITASSTSTITITGSLTSTSKLVLSPSSGNNYNITTGFFNVVSGKGTLDASTNSATSTITVNGTSGTLFNGAGTFSFGNTTMLVTSASGTLTLLSGSRTYYNLTINSSATSITLGTSTTVSNNLTVTAGTLRTAVLSVTGTTSVSGTLTDSTSQLKTFNGAVTVNSTGTWNMSNNNASQVFKGGLTVTSGATFTSGTGNYTFNTNAQNIGGTSAITINQMTVTAVTLTNQSTVGLTIGTSLSGTGTLAQDTNAVLNIGGTSGITNLTATASGNTVSYTSTTAGQTVKSTTYNNLTINDSGQTATLGGAVTVNGNLAISAGTLDVSGSNYAIGLAGNFTNSGTFTARSGTVTLNGSGVQTFSGTFTGSSSLYDLTITNSSGTDASDGELTGFVAGVIYGGSLTSTHNYTITTPSVRVQYHTGSTYTFTNINWNGGATGTRIFFRNSATSGTWLLAVSGTQTAVTYINISRSDATGGNPIAVTTSTSVDSGNNTNWVFNQTPNVPSALGPSSRVNGSHSSNTQPTLTFTLSDPDGSDTVQYEIIISTHSNFSSPAIDYTSALAAQGSFSFSVGQSAGSGSYATGSSGQRLAIASYYWEVRAIDNSSAASSYAVANSGAVAFVITHHPVVSSASSQNQTTTVSTDTPTSIATPTTITTTTPPLVTAPAEVTVVAVPSIPLQFIFTKILTVGMKGADVSELQKYLNSHGYSVAKSGLGSLGNEIPVFGSATRAALIRFQEAHAKDILTPAHLLKGTGVFGSATIRFVNANR